MSRKIKKSIKLFILLSLLCSCGVSDDRIDAYNKATKKVKKAHSSEALELIAYDLNKTLYEIDADKKSLSEMKELADSGSRKYNKILDAIMSARRQFDEALSDKETVFYMERLLDGK